jgi:hypothetical protein
MKDIERLLNDHIIESIVRHYNIIKKNKYSYENEISQNSENYDNIVHISNLPINNIHNDENILEDDLIFDKISLLQEYINNKEEESYNLYKNEIIEDDLTEEEISQVNETVSKFINNACDHMYVRMAPNIKDNPELKNILIKNILIKNAPGYYNSMTDEQINRICELSLPPINNEDYMYSNAKKEHLSQIEDNDGFIN